MNDTHLAQTEMWIFWTDLSSSWLCDVMNGGALMLTSNLGKTARRQE